MSMRALCNECGHEFHPAEASVPVEDRKPCPGCGSRDRRFEYELVEQISVQDELGLQLVEGAGMVAVPPAEVRGEGTVVDAQPAEISTEASPVELSGRSAGSSRARGDLTVDSKVLKEIAAGDYVRVIRVIDLVNGIKIVDVLDEGGNILGSGEGDSVADAVLALLEHWVPPGDPGV